MTVRVIFIILTLAFAVYNYAMASGKIRWDKAGKFEGSDLDNWMQKNSLKTGHSFTAVTILQVVLLVFDYMEA